MGGTRGQKGSITKKYSTSELAYSGYTGLLLEICLLEEDKIGLCGAVVAV